jgi:transcriptional regulator CtsR
LERKDVTKFGDNERKDITSFHCQTIRIGSFKFDSKEKVRFVIVMKTINKVQNFVVQQVVITNRGIRIVAPEVTSKHLILLDIQHSEIVKVVVHFSKQLNVIFLFTTPSCSRYIAEQSRMTESSDKSVPSGSPFLSPKIVLMAKSITEKTRSMIQKIYGRVLDEISYKEANEMIQRSTDASVTASVPTVAIEEPK